MEGQAGFSSPSPYPWTRSVLDVSCSWVRRQGFLDNVGTSYFFSTSAFLVFYVRRKSKGQGKSFHTIRSIFFIAVCSLLVPFSNSVSASGVEQLPCRLYADRITSQPLPSSAVDVRARSQKPDSPLFLKNVPEISQSDLHSSGFCSVPQPPALSFSRRLEGRAYLSQPDISSRRPSSLSSAVSASSRRSFRTPGR